MKRSIGLSGRGPRHRRGATAILTAVMSTVLIGFVAFTVDTMAISVARHQASTAADAAALAGASRLVTESRLSSGSLSAAEMTAAHDVARDFARSNRVLGDQPVIVGNTANAAGGDIVIGYLKLGDPGATLQLGASAMPLFNSVQVTVARSENRGGVVPPFFSRVLGSDGTAVRAQSTATVQNYTIAGFTASGGGNADLLPIVLDENTYKKMISPDPLTTDEFSYNPSTGKVTPGPDGIKESRLYPVKTGNPGNWGTVNIGTSNNSTKTLGDQIRYGVTPEQLAKYPGGELKLDATKNPPQITLGGDPGISAGIKDDLEAIIGLPRTIPIYRDTGGNGNNAWYQIVGFAPVRVLDVNFKGNPKHVIVQPAFTNDPSAIPGSEAKGWNEGGIIRLHLTR